MMLSVIGGSGFIGTRLCRKLAEKGVKFQIIDKAQSAAFPDKVSIADVRSIENLRVAIAEASVIINLAAEHRDDVRPVSLYDEVNVGGARNVCKVAEEKGINKIIFTSSVAVYGFASPGTDETGDIHYFNDYGRTKWEAEKIYREWQEKDPQNRTLVVVRPTVVFGEQNRGNVYNLLNQIASGRFIMIGAGTNMKSMAYVENVVSFLQYSIDFFKPGVHVYNYVDKPDFDMNTLVSLVRAAIGKSKKTGFSIPYFAGLTGGYFFDLAFFITRRSFPISSIRVKKFCATTQFETSINKTGFKPPVSLIDGLKRTVSYEFLENNADSLVFYTE